MNNINPDDQARIDAIEKALLARWPENRIAPTLERISALVDMLGSPQLTYPTIHIGGTNGKTTTSRMVDSLLFEMGLRTGRFTSPHLESYLERICINGQPIDAKEMIFSFNDISPYLDLMDTKFDNPISFFEAITALAFAAFAEHPIDVGVIEVGMGGQWDATNVVDADVSVIMPIGLDHMEYLGNTIAEIATTKAGIIKEQGFVVLAQQEPEAAVELLRRAAEVGADVAREGLEYSIDSRAIAVGGQLISITGLRGHYDDIFLPLHGKHQASNAAAALIAVEAFFGEQDLDIDAVRAGFANVTSPGRCEIIHRDPTIILDAAHNPHGAKAIAETIQSEFTFDDVTGIVALMADKDALGILQALEPIMNQIIVTTNSAARSMAVGDLEALATQIFGADRVFAQPTLTDAIDKAIKDSVRPLSEESLAILITGSVVTVGEARTAVRKKYAKSSIEEGK
ncbi:dihydrofolate synthase / folylpolyglutamate synthase [Candidatus Planktophila lacus]|jgi:dihydrofolate synthase/folylpolyglutamate synthase|uniref:bifunctional folylpolyglutamate synthase/dihydrofolate synthase n=1 Tax=Candidatus Planktophila lacus TaxID=1884913 RepID=UPI000BACAA25|nr:folylpolyglutamate synthase/dihydrofolate synthase family protein [Candidatus Planktophila lacus]ASY25304.1 dihydrofolate synthase / folylpolyglutamate synthase [Candidatus Planktophila lacus]ASY29265.1 dihydrofolate synthase / folylpolyglutamate synthase [Candidatus Planktophila lacus]